MLIDNRVIKSLIFYCISAFGVSLNLKASIGVSSINAMNMSVAAVTNIKVGTITIIMNLVFILIYMILTKFKLIKKYVVLAVAVFLFGTIINLFYYGLLGHLVLNHYILRVITFCLGTLISGIAVGIVITIDALSFPIESVCLIISEKTPISFMISRYSIDVITILISVGCSYFFSSTYYVREGTVIAFLLFTAAVDFSRKKVAPSFC